MLYVLRYSESIESCMTNMELVGRAAVVVEVCACGLYPTKIPPLPPPCSTNQLPKHVATMHACYHGCMHGSHMLQRALHVFGSAIYNHSGTLDVSPNPLRVQLLTHYLNADSLWLRSFWVLEPVYLSCPHDASQLDHACSPRYTQSDIH